MGACITIDEGFVDHFLKEHLDPEGMLAQVNSIIDWGRIDKLLKRHYKKKSDAVVQPAYPALTLFKILLLQRWHNLSDHGAAAALNDRISFLLFCGLSFHSATPDAAMICWFWQALLKKDVYRQLLEEINAQLESLGILAKKGVVVDATLGKSCRRPRKVIDVMPVDRQESEASETSTEHESGSKVSYSDDVETSWVKKGKEPHYGYKAHSATDGIVGFFLTGRTTPAHVADTTQLGGVVADLDLPPKTLIVGDKVYDSRKNREMLVERHLLDGILQKAQRGRPLCDQAKRRNRGLSFMRYVVEQAFGAFKRRYGFQRARYVGRRKTELELNLIGMADNLRKAIGLAAV